MTKDILIARYKAKNKIANKAKKQIKKLRVKISNLELDVKIINAWIFNRRNTK